MRARSDLASTDESMGVDPRGSNPDLMAASYKAYAVSCRGSDPRRRKRRNYLCDAVGLPVTSSPAGMRRVTGSAVTIAANTSKLNVVKDRESCQRGGFGLSLATALIA
jgi:hypothetical protein